MRSVVGENIYALRLRRGGRIAAHLERKQTKLAVFPIPREFLISTHKDTPTTDGGGDNNPVKGIRMASVLNGRDRQVVEMFQNIVAGREYCDAVLFNNPTRSLGATQLEPPYLLKLDYLYERYFGDKKIILIIKQTLSQRLGKLATLARKKPNKSMRVKQVPHALRPKGSSTNSLYLLNLTIFRLGLLLFCVVEEALLIGFVDIDIAATAIVCTVFYVCKDTD